MGDYSLPDSYVTIDCDSVATDDVHVLVTGFGPFRSSPLNPSFLIASALPRCVPLEAPTAERPYPRLLYLHVYPRPVRVSYEAVRREVPRMNAAFRATHRRYAPDILLHIGVATSRDYYSVEHHANRDGYQFPDVDGRNGCEAGEKRWREEGLPPVLLPGPTGTEEAELEMNANNGDEHGEDDTTGELKEPVPGEEDLENEDAHQPEEHKPESSSAASATNTNIPPYLIKSPHIPGKTQHPWWNVDVNDAKLVFHRARRTGPYRAEQGHVRRTTRHAKAVFSKGRLFHPAPPDDALIDCWRAHCPPARHKAGQKGQHQSPQPIDVRLSTDAGNYLCEFIYYTSLAYACRKRAMRSALFLHVPGGTDEASITRGVEVTVALIKSVVECWERKVPGREEGEAETEAKTDGKRE